MSPLIMLLLSLGGSLGPMFIKNPQLQSVVATAVSAAGTLITNLLNKKPGQSIAMPTSCTPPRPSYRSSGTTAGRTLFILQLPCWLGW